MNEQQLAAVKQALEALEMVVADVKTTPTAYEAHRQAITALQSIISQDALDWMADNARELGLNYDTPLSAFVRSSDEDKAEVMERVIDKAIEAQKEKIGCVNHDCDQCKAAQKPWVGLTDDELVAAIYELEGFAFGLDNGNVSDKIVVEYARLVEAKLKEKNHV